MKQRGFYGWWVIGALALALMISSGTGFYCFGVFIEPVIPYYRLAYQICS